MLREKVDTKAKRLDEIQARGAALMRHANTNGASAALARGIGNSMADLLGASAQVSGMGECKGVRLLEGVISGEGSVRSLRDAYVMITGDKGMTGKWSNCSQTSLLEFATDDSYRVTEAISTSAFANVLGAAVGRQMLRRYNEIPFLSAWRKVVQVTSLDQFRTHRRVKVGGYGNLPGVGEGAPYSPMTSPAEDSYEIALAKRGGTESINLEAIANDDVGLVRQIAQELALSAAHTLFEFVFDFLKDNPVIYDGAALFGVGRGNLGSAALSLAGLSGAYRAQSRFENVALKKRAYVKPRFVVVPLDLEETAFNLFQRNLNLDKTFIQARGLEVLPVPYWTDPNDWILAGDPAASPTIEVSFFGGREEPELFVSDLPNGGSLFTNDQVTYKIRHIYGGAVADWRAFYKNAV